MECIKCGHQNAAESQRCAACNLNLASLELNEDGMAQPVYDRYLELRRAVSDRLDGKSTPDEFKRFLDNVSFKMANKEQEIRELEIPSQVVDDFRDELEIGFEGIDLYNRALQHLRQFMTTNDPMMAGSGLELAWAGNEKINEARRMNRKARQVTSDEDFAASE